MLDEDGVLDLEPLETLMLTVELNATELSAELLEPTSGLLEALLATLDWATDERDELDRKIGSINVEVADELLRLATDDDEGKPSLAAPTELATTEAATLATELAAAGVEFA